MYQKLKNEDAEMALLGALLIHEQLIHETHLSEDDFTSDKNKLVFKRMREMANDGVILDPVVLGEHFEEKRELQKIGGPSYFLELMNSTPINSISAFKHYEEIIKSKTTKRKLYRLLHEYTGYIQNDDAELLSEEIISELSKIRDESSSKKAVNISEGRDAFIKRLPSFCDASLAEDRMSTGIPDIDKAINRLSKSDFTIITAKPGAGKTTLALEMADNITCAGGAVLWLTAEMLMEEIYQKLIARNTGISISQMEQGMLRRDELEYLEKATDEIDDRNLFVLEISGCNIYNLLSETRRFKRTHDVDLVVIDYLQLLKNHLRSADRFENLRDASSTINEFCKREKVPVIGIASLNQSGNVYGVSQASYDCNNHIKIVKKFETNDDGVEKDCGKRYIAVTKARRGGGGLIKARLIGETAQLYWKGW